MSDLRASISIDLAGNLERRAQRYGQSLGRFSQQGNRYLRGLSRTAQATGRMLDRVGNRYTALLTGAAGAGTARMVMQLEERFTRLGIQANVGADQVNRLKRSIYEAAQAPDVRVDPGQVTAAVEAIVEKTGDLKFAQDNLRNIGLAIQATGAEGQNIGEILAEMQKAGITGPEAVLQVLDTLNQQGKAGAFTLQNLAALGPRVVSAYMAMRPASSEAFREMGAVLQVIRQGTGSSEQAATSFEALMRVLGDTTKLEVLQRGGIQVFDPEALKAGRRELRPINQIMEEIITRARGDRTIIQKVLGDSEAVRAFNAAVGEFGRLGGVESLNKFMAIHGDGSATINDSARAAKTASAAMQSLYTAWQKFADSELTGPIQSLADSLNSLEPGTVDRWMQVGKWAAIIGGGAVLAKKLGVGKLAGRMLGKGGAAGALGSAVGMAGVTPVFVVNMPGGLGGKGGLPGLGGGKGGPSVRTPGRWQLLRAAPNLKTIGAMGAGAVGTAGAAVAAAGAAGWGIGRMIDKYLLSDDTRDTIGGTIATVLAKLGNEEAQRALDVNLAARAGMAPPSGRVTAVVELDDKRARVREVRSDSPDLDMEVDSGLTMMGP